MHLFQRHTAQCFVLRRSIVALACASLCFVLASCASTPPSDSAQRVAKARSAPPPEQGFRSGPDPRISGGPLPPDAAFRSYLSAVVRLTGNGGSCTGTLITRAS